MTREMFFDELGRIFDKTPKPEQLAVYHNKLRRFSSEQLIEILNRVIEESRTYPKVSEIFKAAEQLGYLSADLTGKPTHHWEHSESCKMCWGEGRLCIYWEVHFEERDNGRVEVQSLKTVLQYSKSSDYKPSQNEFRTIFRCRCDAGEKSTIPKCWPKLSRATPSRREVWA